MNLVYEYIKYIVKGQGRHQIHSPFVFDFVDVCIRNKVAKEDRIIQKKFRDSLLNNKNEFEFEQFGAGSKKKNNNKRVSSYAKHAGSHGKYWDLLYNISNHYKPKHLLELGTNFGFGTLAFHLGNPRCKITTIEGSKTLHDINSSSFSKFDLNQFRFINSTFESYFNLDDSTLFDLIFIDGDHRSEALIENIEKSIKHSHNKTLIIIDDIRWSDDMFSTWEQIIKDKRFNLTMDLFRIGIIAKMPGKEKEHFVIKY
jgi:predicted O-methyltransferase YrrM